MSLGNIISVDVVPTEGNMEPNTSEHVEEQEMQVVAIPKGDFLSTKSNRVPRNTIRRSRVDFYFITH